MRVFLTVVIVAVVVFAGVVAMQPNDFRVSRSLTMAAPAATVFEQVNNLHKWDAWSPWAKLDPNAKASFDGPEEGVGASMHWASDNKQVGEGSMKIVESNPAQSIKFQLDFIKPMEGTNTAEFEFKTGDANQTTVTWSMYGKQNFVAKAIGLIFNCEKMVGGQFEEGLNSMKQVSEAATTATAPVAPSVTAAPAPSTPTAVAPAPASEAPAVSAPAASR